MFKHKVESKTFSKSNIKMAKVNFINITMAQDISEAVFNIFTIYLFYIFVKNGTSTIGAYMAFIPIKEAITGTINGFIKLKINKKSFEVAYNQINEIITIEQYLKSNTTENFNTQISYIENINFSNLDFTYPTSEKQYKLNYKFEKNNCYLILGKNGIGKSTMIKLLSGILPCDNNKILINNSPLKLNNEQFNCDKISILPQNIKMFEKSIIDLIINEDIIINKQISTKFNVNNIISSIIDSSFDSMSNNIDISQLSGGEKKKILLSLIFSSNTDLIILDEPFAELDNNAKQVLVELINTYIKNKIIIIITHEIPKEFDNIDTTAIQMIDEDNIITLKTQDKLECKC